MPTKTLGMDVGDKRIGLAISDDLGMMAHGLPTLERRNPQYDLDYLKNLLEEYEIQKIVVGLPLNMNGQKGPRAQIVLAFTESLQKELSIPVVNWDERLSSQAAQRPLMEAGVKWRKRRKVIDQLAAIIILQNYLDHKRHIDHPRTSTPNPYQK